jgi:hypothetical protein
MGEIERRRHFGNISWKAAVLETATDLEIDIIMNILENV